MTAGVRLNPDSRSGTRALQRILAEGDFVASTKFALLHALTDLSIELGDDSGAGLRIPTRAIAEKYITYYWKQVRPYVSPGSKSGILLSQNTGKQAAVLSAIQDASQKFQGSLARLMRSGKPYEALVREVQGVIEKMPLWKLQTVGRGSLIFLYENRFSRPHEIELLPGVAFCFRRFHELILDLVQNAWTRWLRQLRSNQGSLGQVADLSEFLFGSERQALKIYRPILLELQSGLCFYCAKPMREEVAVDHFVPWTKYQIDLGHNFVLAHRSCNLAKSDRLADLPHLENWWERNERHHAALEARFNDAQVVHNLEISQTVTQWAYLQAAKAGAVVWKEGIILAAIDLRNIRKWSQGA